MQFIKQPVSAHWDSQWNDCHAKRRLSAVWEKTALFIRPAEAERKTATGRRHLVDRREAKMAPKKGIKSNA